MMVPPPLLTCALLMTSSDSKGASHRIRGEAANLPELAMRSGLERAADELAHVCFFPVLILHTSFQNLGWAEPPGVEP